MRTEEKKPLLWLLAIVIVVQIVLAGAWIGIDRTPPYWDEAWYLLQGAVQLKDLQHGGLQTWFHTWSTMDNTRPSLVPTLVMPFFATLGVSATSGLLLNVVALVVLLLVTYALGSAIHSPRAGLLSAIVVGSFPALIGLVHILMVEMVMLTFVAATLLALWRSDGFRRSGWTFAAGLLTGLGFLTKVFFGVFVVGPWLITIWVAWRNRPRGTALVKWTSLRNLAMGLFVAVVTAGTWYAQNLASVLRRSADAAVGAEAAAYGPPNPWYWRNLLAYLFSVIGEVISPIEFVLLLLALVGLIWAYRRHHQDPALKSDAQRTALLFLTSSIVIAYLVFTSIHNQDRKHITGILPALAVLIGSGMTELLRRRWAVGAAVAGIVMVVNVVLGTFPGPLQNRNLVVTVLGEPLLLLHPAQSPELNTTYAAAEPSPWPLSPVLNYAVSVGQLIPDRKASIKVGIIPDAPGIEEYAFRFEAYRQEIPVKIETANHMNLKTMDVLIHKTGNWGWAPQRHAEIEKLDKEVTSPESQFHRLPRTFGLPDGSEVVLYARVPPILDANQPKHEVSVEFGENGRFVGYDYSASGKILNLTYHWESLAPMQDDFSVFVHLVDPETGEIVAQDDHLLFDRVYPTSIWQPERFVAESRQVLVPATYTGASLILRVGLYHDSTRMPITSSSNVQASLDYADVGRISLNP